MLALNDVTYRYPGAATSALSNVSFELEKGALLGLLGVNGAGKSTLVSLLMGLRQPENGYINYQAEPVSLGRPDIGFVPQEYAFYEDLSVRENLHYFAAVALHTKRNQQAAIDRVIEQCALSSLAQKQAKSCSGGEKRRLNLAIALLNVPSLLILDEPTANVDPHARAEILALVRAINDAGTTIIYTSHLLGEVEALSDTIALIHAGRLLQFGGKDALLSKQATHLQFELSTPTIQPALHPAIQLAIHDVPLFKRWGDAICSDGASGYVLDLSRIDLSISNCLSQIEAALGPVQSVKTQSESLEDVFLSLTQSRQVDNV